MAPDPLLRAAVAYHGVLGATFVLVPRDVLTALAMDPPRYWTLWYATASAPLLAAAILHLARKRPVQRSGLLLAVALGEVTAMVLGCFFVVWEGLPRVLLGPACAAGVWAWFLWGIAEPEEIRAE